MMTTTFVVLAYDIPDDRRRTRLFKTLKRFGFAVQESVFEFHLTQTELRRLRKTVRALIDEREDQVRYYFLCPSCHARTETTCTSIRSRNPIAVIA